MNEQLFTKQMSALSDTTRLKLVYVLYHHKFCAMHLEEFVGASQSNVSRHLEKLLNSHIITVTKVGRRNIYDIDENFKLENEDLLQKIINIYSEVLPGSKLVERGNECDNM